jgi:DNA-binding response OmpR family regulator
MTSGWKPPPSARILVVDDDRSARRDLTNALLAEGYEVCVLDEGTTLDRLLERFVPDLALIDFQPSAGAGGRAVAERLLNTGMVQVVFVTGASHIQDRLAGFALGADDYITKPFVMAELVARVRAVLRRTGRVDAPVLQAGLVRLDLNRHVAYVDGSPLALTKTEFALLEAFCRAPERVLSKSHLMNRIWIYDGMNPNVVEVHVSALRRKMAPHAPRLIETVHGVGYVLRTDVLVDEAGAAS